MKTFNCRLITPLGNLYHQPTIAIVAPGSEGRFEILAGHEHLMAILKSGILKIRSIDYEKLYAIDSGILEVDGDHSVLILADHAIEIKSEADAQVKLQEFKNLTL